MEHPLILLSGPSGVGKKTVLDIALELCRDLRHTVSHTTRARRPGELEGRDYHYIDRDTFRAMITRDEFLEWNEYKGQLYGTHRSELEEGVVKIAEIDINGVRQVKQHLPGTPMIFMLPDSPEVLRARIVARGGNLPHDEIEWRVARGLQELEEGPALADYSIVNPEGAHNCELVAMELLEIIQQILAS